MNTRSLATLLTIFLINGVSYAQSNNRLSVDFKGLTNSHDISLSAWGPYSKKYAGISHIYDMKAGMRFDFSVLPGFYRNKMLIPNVTFESGYFPWDVSSDLTRYTYRYELEWKDKVFVDVTYSVIDSLTVLVSMKCVNNTLLPQNLSLNLVQGIEYPDTYPSNTLVHSKNAVWVNAVDYVSLDYAQKRPKDGLVTDGWMRGEVRDSEFIDGSAIGQNFGKDKGDRASFTIDVKKAYQSGSLSFVYRMKENTSCTFLLSGLTDQAVTLHGNGKLTSVKIPFQRANKEDQTLIIESEGGAAVDLNGIVYTPAAEDGQMKIIANNKTYSPEITANSSEKKLIAKYKDIPMHYGVRWFGDNDFRLRQIKNDELDVFFRYLVHSHVDSVLKGNNKGDYSNIFIRPIELEPQSEQTIYATICTGSLQQVTGRLNDFGTAQEIKQKEELPVNNPFATVLPQGKKYVFSQKMLRATVLTNIVYPIYTQRNYIRHFTPGKWWNSLYTWDLGFVALGLNEINVNTAAECINAYTTPVGGQSAFIHHGSPVPVQMYAFLELWNKTQSKESLQYFYPRLKQYYEFMAGRLSSSTTRTLKSNMIKTWDYFYNSGGWDDYPAQVEVHKQKAEQFVAPVINTAQAIRTAKILRMAAETLGEKADIAMYDKDIKDFSDAVQNYSWNDTSGYFSYVVHDVNGYPSGRLKYTDGKDYNMGLDGAYPLVAGICTPSQQDRLIEKIFSPKNMWTPSGISVVDQAAPYYKIDGYWNGSVWMPHQWFIWKTMLDLGKPELAFKIATKGLDVYQKETDESYYTFEHFLAKSGRGAGWHQFSGLSTPVLSWFSAYYKPGTVTTGFEIWIKNQSFNKTNSSYKANISFDNATVAHNRSIIVCLNPGYTYHVAFNGVKLDTVQSPYAGLLQITLAASNKDGVLEVTGR